MYYLKPYSYFAALLKFSSLLLATLTFINPACMAQSSPLSTNQKYDAEAAKRLGADERGMRSYVLVVLKTGPNRVATGKERDEMFAGHFINMKRLAAEGKLVLAGPFDGLDGWRGLFVFAVKDIEEAKQLTATDPVIIKGEMIAEYHKWYGSAALMDVGRLHETLSEKNP
ncbi:YciI family protein [Undibacterium sp. Di24W]|uniref:YciI family protein n=1 Tax=Undibacterium sp. Di24W TaxID=3413033 RepID=UPI003BF045E2